MTEEGPTKRGCVVVSREDLAIATDGPPFTDFTTSSRAHARLRAALAGDPSAGSPEIDGDVARIREALVRDDPADAREELRAAVDAIRADERDRASRRILDYRARYVTDSAVAYANGLMRASLLALDVVRDDPGRLVTLRSDEPVAVPLALLYRADSVCSLVAYRGLDDEARRELADVSGKIRAITNEAERG